MSGRPTFGGSAVALGLLLASAVVFPRASATALRTQQFVLSFEMAASRPTVAEIFVDRGAGYDALGVMTLDVAMASEPRPYVVPLAAGRYRAIRLDPFSADGELILRNARIEDRYGHTVASLDLSKLAPSPFVRIASASPNELVATAISGHSDPQLAYAFDPPLVLWLSQRDLAMSLLTAVLIAVLGAVVGYVVQRADRPVAMHERWHAYARPRTAIVLTALVSTVLAVYPLFVGRSLVTPNNGPVALVYAAPPYAVGSTDTGIEDARSSDVPATMWVTLPYAVAQRTALAHREVPWWNRFSEHGVPLLGQAQTSFFDPLQWLVLVGDLALGADLKFIAARFVFVSGCGLAAFAASGSFGAAMVIALAAPFIGHFIGRLNDPIHFSIVYAPWILVAYGALLQSDSRYRACLAAAGILVSTALVMVSSSVKETFALLPSLHVAGATAVVLHAQRTARWRDAIVKVALAVLAAAGAALLTAPHWLIFFETLQSAATAYDTSAMVFARLPQAVALFAGALIPGVVFPGLNPLLMVLVVFAVVRPRRWFARPLVAGCVIVTAALLAIAFGAIPEPLLMQLPLVHRIHHVGSTFVTAALPLMIVIAAAGAADLPHYLRGDTRWVAPAVGIAIGVSCIASMGTTSDLLNANFGMALTGCAWTGVLGFLLLRVAAEPTRLVVVLTAVVTAFLLLPSGLHLPSGLAAVDRLLMQPRERVSLTAVPPSLTAVKAQVQAEPARILGLNGAIQGGVPTYLGLEGITGADALYSGQTFWLGKQFEYYFPLQFRSADPRREHHGPLLDLWGVRWVVVPTPRASGDRLEVMERPSAWPRAFFVDRTEQHADRTAFLHRLVSDTRPFASVYANDHVAREAARAIEGAATTIGQAADYTLTANTTSFTITAPAPGLVVLNEGFWPGVYARVNGRPTTVLRVNETMRGVVVPKGTWQITFGFRPALWNAALVIAAAGAAILIGLLAAGLIALRRGASLRVPDRSSPATS